MSSTESESEESERFLISSDSGYDSVAYDPVKTRLSELEAEVEAPANRKAGVEHCHWFILPLLLATPTMQFSLDHKRRTHKQSQFFSRFPTSNPLPFYNRVLTSPGFAAH